MKFEVYKNKLIVIPESLHLDSLKRIYDKYTKAESMKVLLYIYYTCDKSYDNPLSTISYKDIKSEAAIRAFGSEDIPTKYDVDIRDAELEYMRELNSFDKIMDSYGKKMDQYREMLSGMKPVIHRNVDRNDVVSYTTNMGIITGTLTNIIDIIKAKASITSINVSGETSAKLRGVLQQ